MVMLITLIWAGPWLVSQLMEYTQNLIQNIPYLIG
jgi:flagellar biosynthetic protein FliQ